jgi:putative aldouronate transport system permease protein
MRAKSGRTAFRVLNGSIMVLLCVITVFPFLNALAYAFSDPIKVLQGWVSIFPRGFTLENFQRVFQSDALPRAAFISVSRTVLGIIYHVFFTGIAAYALSFVRLPFNRTLTLFFIIPMFVFPGMIPVYVNISQLGLMNSFWVYVLPHAFGAYIMLIMRTYFRGIPMELIESAYIDGAGQMRIFAQVIVPLSMPIIAVVALFHGVWQWNSWLDAMLYVNRVKLHPLSMLLQRMIQEAEDTEAMMVGQGGYQRLSPQSVRMTMLVVITAPIVLIYPFFQRYFVKGVMIGAVKG